MVRGYDPYIWHANTPSSPISNFGKSTASLASWVFKDGEVYLHMHFFLVPPASSRMSGSVLSGPTRMTLKMPWTMKLLSLSKPWSGEGEGNQGDRGCWSLCLLLCPWPWEGGSGCLLVIRTVVYGHISRWGGPWGIKLKRLLGWWIYSGTSRSPCLHSII